MEPRWPRGLNEICANGNQDDVHAPQVIRASVGVHSLRAFIRLTVQIFFTRSRPLINTSLINCIGLFAVASGFWSSGLAVTRGVGPAQRCSPKDHVPSEAGSRVLFFSLVGRVLAATPQFGFEEFQHGLP